MSNEDSLEVGFTQVLYGVVVANAIYQLEFDLGFRNFMLLLMLAFILGDWIEYQIQIGETSGTTANYATAFVLDVVILIVWYLMTTLTAADLDWFFAVAGIFFFLQATWDKLILGHSVPTLLRKPHLQLTLFFFALAGAEWFLSLSQWLLLEIATVVFFARKTFEWRTLLTRSPEAL